MPPSIVDPSVPTLGTVPAAPPARRTGSRSVPLIEACVGGAVMPVMRLIRDGADLNGGGLARWTPLHHAVVSDAPADDRAEIVRQLRQAGARDDLVNAEGATPLDLARRAGVASPVLDALRSPVNPDAMLLLVLDQWRSPARGYDQRCRQALRLGADPWSRHPDRQQPLIDTAVDLDRGGALARFHAHGVDLNAALDEDGMTPLMSAAFSNRLIATYALLRAGVTVNLQNRRGNTALHLALFNSSVVAALLDAGADPSIANDQGLTVWGRLAGHERDAGSASETQHLAATRRTMVERRVRDERHALRAVLDDLPGPAAGPMPPPGRSRL